MEWSGQTVSDRGISTKRLGTPEPVFTVLSVNIDDPGPIPTLSSVRILSGLKIAMEWLFLS